MGRSITPLKKGAGVVRRSDLVDCLDRNPNRCREQHERYNSGRERLCFAVAERVSVVGIARREPQTSPNNSRREDILPHGGRATGRALNT